MKRLLFALALSTTILPAQFSRLVTGSNGSQVVFSSSLSLNSEPTHDWPKLFEATTYGVRLLDERFRLSPPAPLPTMETFYELLSRDQSSDGSVLALNTSRTCSGGSRCVFVERAMGEITAPGRAEPLLRGGIFRLSADGRYAFSYGSWGPVPLHAILDLWTASVTPLPQRPTSVAPPGRRVIANNGTAVFLDLNGAVMLASRDALITVAKTSMPASAAIIENEGRYLIYETATTPHQLMLYDISADWELPLLWAEEGCSQPALSDDGLQLLFLSAANWAAENNQLRVQAWLFDLNTGVLHQLTHDTAGIAEATLSGDGQVAWAVTLAGSLLRIDVNSSTVSETVGRTAVLDDYQVPCTPDSQCIFTGKGLAADVFTAEDPLPFTLGGIEVKVDGIPLPLVSVAPTEIRFVLPWALQTGQHRWEVTPGDSIFQQKNTRSWSIAAAPPAF